jgi:hypothetical protein
MMFDQNLAEAIDLAVDELLDGSDRLVLVGPIVRNVVADNCYFVAVTGKAGLICSSQINCGVDTERAEESRATLFAPDPARAARDRAESSRNALGKSAFIESA